MASTTWTISRLQDEIRRFETALRAAGLRDNTVRTYMDRSSSFIRRLEGDYVPTGPDSR